MKYIDADKLIAEIERRIIEHKKSIKKDITLISEAMLKGSLGAYESIESFITSLQQEQPEVEKEIEMYISSKGLSDYAFLVPAIARHFYELGKSARKE